jgi:FtsH-binding integral membrane protein
VLVEGLNFILGLVGLALFVAKVVAFIDSLRHPEGAYPAAGKQTKTLWVVLLGASAALQFFLSPGPALLSSPIGLFSIAGTVVTGIYFVDVRPAVRQYGGRGGSSSQGPYGPW